MHNFSVGFTFTVYLLLVFAVGVYAYRRTHNTTDYFLGGRGLSPFVCALSAGASDMSGWVMIGLPGFAYLAGLEAVWMAGGLCVGVALSWLLVAKRLRVYSFQLDDALTLPMYFHRRFNSKGPWLRGICAVFILLFFLFYVSSGLVGGAKLFASVFGMDYQWAVLFGALAVISYTLFGGFLAVCWTDVVKALLMSLGLIVVPVLIITGLPDFTGVLASKNPAMLDMWSNQQGEPLTFVAWASLVGWGLAYFGQPHILARYKGINSAENVGKAAAIAIGWSLLVYSFSILVGMSGAAFIEQPLPDSEKVFIVLVEMIFNPWVAGVLLAAILAAIMSTVDSQLLVCSSALAEDLLAGWGKPVDSRVALKLGRVAVVVIAVFAAILALNPESKVLDVVAYAWGGLGAAFGPALLVSLYWPRMTFAGAMAGVVVGGSVVVIWAQLHGGWFDLYELVPGFFLSLVSVFVVSLLTPVPGESVLRHFNTMRDEVCCK
ncbi:MAG: sodium/proline symporter PutP [Spongiibacteraceae bacterium]|nr:sodium/proline symporter PutP [Spongiibacteraceae bacterium]